jgi:type IV secretory pathway protease TraF
MTPRVPLLALGALAVATTALRPAAPQLLWNTTASAPLGLWTLQPSRHPIVGDWLAVRPPAALATALAARGVLPKGVLLLKQVGARAPSRVCRRGDGLWIDSRWRAHVLDLDRWGRALPQWRGCRALHADELFLLNAAEGSLDSRYFGPLRAADIVAQARPWLTTVGGGRG